MGIGNRLVEDDCMTERFKCPKCHKDFDCDLYPQTPGFRFPEDLYCPYCGTLIKTSMEYEFSPHKVKDDNRHGC